MPRFWWVILEALVIGVMSDSVAVVLMNAVDSSNVGLAQLVLWGIELAKLMTMSIPGKSAGAHHQLHGVGQFLLALLPPFMSWQVAVLTCPSFRKEQVWLVCPILTLNP
jgi:hypothetical protein